MSFSRVIHSEEPGIQDLIHLPVLAKHDLTFWQPALHIVKVETEEKVEDFSHKSKNFDNS